MLAAWSGGDEGALDGLIDQLYPTLQQIAHQHLGRRRRGESLESAALANEAYLKLAHAGGIPCENRAHFLALCSQVMRRIIVDHARRRAVAKRGGEAVRLPLDDMVAAEPPRDVDVLALNEALEALGRIDPRKCRVVELRYFGGLSIEETAQVLGVSDETVKRDWRMARAWLLSTLTGKQGSPARRR
jgi:RNA polymerase sigma factor (TIGR02999 family)